MSKPSVTNHGVQPLVEASAGLESMGLESMITELYEKSGNSGLSREQFSVILNEVAAKYLPADASARETAELYASLRVEELALARACAAGQERAWEIFMARYREKLYDIAALHRQGKFGGARTCRFPLRRSIRNHDSRRSAHFETRVLYRARLFGRLAAHGDGTGVREPLSPPAPPGQPG